MQKARFQLAVPCLAKCGIIQHMNMTSIAKCMMVAALFASACVEGASPRRITSEGDYPSHLQGVCTDGKDIWWSHTTEIARTDRNGKVLAHVKKLQSHHGDLCVVDGTVYVAVNLGKFNTEDKADSWVYAYKGDSLSFIKRWKVPELCHGAGGMTYKDGKFFIVGGLPPEHSRNYVYEYTADFVFVKRHVLESGWTCLGIQTVDYSDGKFVFGCYGGANKVTGEKVPKLALVAGPDFSGLKKVKEDVSIGNMWLDGCRWRATMHVIDKNCARSARRYHVALVPVKSKEL